MIEFKTEKGEFVVVDLPKEVKSVQDSFCDAILTTHHDGYIETYYPLEGNEACELKLICKLSEATEEDAKGVVGSRFTGGGLKSRKREESYKDYVNGGYPRGVTAFYSLKTLLKSKGIDINNGNWYLFKKVK